MSSAINGFILLTFDVEDWFQVENFKKHIDFSTWNSFELRVEKNTHLILDILDSFSFKPKATFFILGWIAKKLPELVKEIHNRGHEIASHGFDHDLCSTLAISDLKGDLLSSKKFLEELISNAVYGYRAPSFSINDDIIAAIKQAGYVYDSSYNSFSGHGRYGSIDLSKATKKGALYQIEKDFVELPISNTEINKKTIPLGGGGYFRLLPFLFFKAGMNRVLKQDNAFVFYSHPWEFDPEQPRVEKASRQFKFRHYINLHKTQDKLKTLINSFSDRKFITCIDYIQNHKKIS